MYYLIKTNLQSGCKTNTAITVYSHADTHAALVPIAHLANSVVGTCRHTAAAAIAAPTCASFTMQAPCQHCLVGAASGQSRRAAQYRQQLMQAQQLEKFDMLNRDVLRRNLSKEEETAEAVITETVSQAAQEVVSQTEQTLQQQRDYNMAVIQQRLPQVLQAALPSLPQPHLPQLAGPVASGMGAGQQQQQQQQVRQACPGA